MDDLDVLKLIMKQEIVAEKRYEQHAEMICDPEVKALLEELRDVEGDHKVSCLEAIHNIDPDYHIDMSFIDTEGFCFKVSCQDEKEKIIEILTVNLEEERGALRSYEGFSNETENPEVALLLKEFIDDEQEHIMKLQNILENLGGDDIIPEGDADSGHYNTDEGAVDDDEA